MMKIYHKKNASFEDETVLVNLERRHTLKEVPNDVGTEELRKTTRANSLDIFEEGHSSTDIEAITTEKKSGFTRRPTVITESELSSSWLYKDRKAKINSDDESVEDPRTIMPDEKYENLEPKPLHDPNLRPAPVSSQRPRKMSSCCWYFAISLVICIACLAVMASVGSIVYMGYFATDKDKLDIMDTDTLVKNDKNPTESKEIVQHPPHKQDNILLNEPKIPENILKDVMKNSAILAPDFDVSRKVPVIISQPKEDILRNQDIYNSNNSKKKTLNEVTNSFASKNEDIEVTENLDIVLNTWRRINHFNVPVSNKSVEIKRNAQNPDSLDLKLNYRNTEDIKDKIPDGHVYDVNEQMTGDESTIVEKSNSGAEISDSNEETLASVRNFNFGEVTTLQGFEIKVEQVNENIPFQNLPKENNLEDSVHLLPNGNSLDHMKNTIENKREDNLFDHRKNSITHDLKDNSLDNAEHSIDHSLEDNSLNHTENFTHQNESLNDHNEDSNDFNSDNSSSEEHSLADDHNQTTDDSAQLVFIRPVVESKAVPVPLAFLRRIGFDIKNPNSHQPMTAQDMDIKFSLAEALKYLRSLDTDNKLPASREKNVTPEASNQEESKKTKLPIISERKEYLSVLRKKIFEQNS